jgi:hypothetical protein
MAEPSEQELLTAVQTKMWEVPVGQLEWDLNCEWGQARSLDPQLTEHYFQSLKSGPEPRQLIRNLLWQRGARMFQM